MDLMKLQRAYVGSFGMSERSPYTWYVTCTEMISPEGTLLAFADA